MNSEPSRGAGDTLPLILSMLIGQFASQADAITEMVSAFRGGRTLPDRMPDPPDIVTWMSFYHDGDKILDFIGDLLGIEAVTGMTFSFFARKMGELDKMPESDRVRVLTKEPPKFLNFLAKLVQPVSDPLEPKFVNALAKRMEEAGPEIPDSKMALICASPAMQFMLRVWVPCYVYYRCPAAELFAKARGGDVDALDDLIKLDKSVLADPDIGAQWHQAAHARSQGLFNRLVRAVRGKPKGRIDGRHVRFALAGLIKQLGRAAKVDITEPAMRKIFDELAKTDDVPRDMNLPTSSDTFYRAMTREQKWSGLPQSEDNRS